MSTAETYLTATRQLSKNNGLQLPVKLHFYSLLNLHKMNNNVKRHIEVLKKTSKELKELELNSGEKACENSYKTLWSKYSKSRIYLDDIANHFLSIENYRDFRIIEDIICAY